MNIDLNNPVFVSPYSPTAEWKRVLLINLGLRFGLKVLVETGTCWGDTIEAAKTHFDQVYSVELDTNFYTSASLRFEGNPRIHLYLGSSRFSLETILKEAPKVPTLFWLDAHLTGGTLKDDGPQVNAELQIISRCRPDALVLIDDVKPEGKGFEEPCGPIILPIGWQAKFLHGVLITHAGSYKIPDKF